MNALFLEPGTPSQVRCAMCGMEPAAGSLPDTCPSCGGLYEVIHARPTASGPQLASAWESRRVVAARSTSAGARGRVVPAASGVWRFADLVMPGASRPVTWPEGNTPLLARESVTAYAGVARLDLKHEGMNPTGSFKDRGLPVAVTDAVRRGARAVACASTGNTAASMTAYAALAGLRALVFIPRGRVAAGKLAQTMAYGGTTLAVDGDFDAALTLAREASREMGIALVNSLNPWRIEGQKTIAWELLEQLGWEPPDWIALPAGALGNTSAFGKALREALDLGLITRMPRLLAVQASGAAPFAAGFANGFRERVSVRAETVATAIRIGKPASWDRAVRAIIETSGEVIAVGDDEILDAKAVVDASGIGCEPASAASVAGVRAARVAGRIAADAQVACILTGHLLKDPEAVAAYHGESHSRSNPPINIAATLRDVERVLKTADA